jgi:hypothetical protein
MKLHSIFMLLALCWGLSSCDEDRITFSEPQPSGVKADNKLRKEFLGKYFCEEDSTFLVISNHKIVEQHVEHTIDAGSKKADVRASFGQDSAVNVRVEVKKDADGEFDVDADLSETHLDLSKGHVAKYFKGYYFLNVPAEEGGYRVRLIRKTREGLIIGRIQSDSLLHLMEQEGYVKKQSSADDEEEKWQLSPNRKELKKLIDRGLFTEVRAYRRIKQ